MVPAVSFSDSLCPICDPDGSRYVVFAPCDAPFLPADLVEHLLAGMRKSSVRMAVAHDGERLQPLHALAHSDCRQSLEAFLALGSRRVGDWMRQQVAVQVDCNGQAGGFFNLNTPAELQGDHGMVC